jgi:hypothetical protein
MFSLLSSNLSLSQVGDREVMAADTEALAQVELVCSETLHAGIQMQLRTPELTSM